MQPIFKLTADDQDISRLIAERLIELNLNDSSGFDSDTLELALNNTGGVLALPRRGVRLNCWLGFKVQGQEQLYYKGMFYVDELTESGAPDQLSIHAKSADMLSTAKVLRTRSFQQTTLGFILERLAVDEGWQLAVSPAFRSLAVAWLLQQDESNLALLTRLGEHYGAVATVKHNRLIFVPRGSLTTASGQAMPAIRVSAQECSGWSYQELGRGEYTSVLANWRNEDGQSGQVSVGSGALIWVMRELFDSEDQAKEAATAELKRLNGDSNTLSLSLSHANPLLCAEAEIQAQGFRPYIDAQTWVAKEVSLSLSASGGFSASVECVRPAALEEGEDSSPVTVTPTVDPNSSKLIDASGFQSIRLLDQVFNDIYSSGVSLVLPSWPQVVRYLARDWYNASLQSGELLPNNTIMVFGSPGESSITNAGFKLYGVDQAGGECYLGSVNWQVLRP